jgi:pimeloyl-ACP methyl ester carboxylesterase
MSNLAKKLSKSHDVSAKVAQVVEKRTRLALARFNERAQQAREQVTGLTTNPTSLPELWASGARYGVDFAQRSILFWDALRRRGNNFVEHERQGLPPVLRFDYEIVMDGRSFKRPVNYALLRIVPPKGVTVDAKRRPYVIIDPRGGHGPGIGGFKDDSQVGVALHEGHPVYFVIFFPKPEPGQTLLDVCDAEREFVHRVRELHPDAPKPGIVGNCQAGWAAMMLAAANPDDTGPIVIVGAPMSYWGGAWSEGEGDNPMRYSGGLLGAPGSPRSPPTSAQARSTAPISVQNFENLNPANTSGTSTYQLFANVDTETGTLSRVRALVGWLLPDEPRGDRVDHSEPLRRQQAVVRRREGGTEQRFRPARHQGSHRLVRIGGRQHHAAAAGVQTGCRRVWQHRGDQGSRAR